MSKRKNPVLMRKYKEGQQDQRHLDVANFAVRIERLENIKGLGEKRLQAIRETINQEITPEEQQRVDQYIKQLRKQEESG